MSEGERRLPPASRDDHDANDIRKRRRVASSIRRRRLRELENEAYRRAYSGNGSGGVGLPPLPANDDDDGDIDDGDHEGGGGGDEKGCNDIEGGGDGGGGFRTLFGHPYGVVPYGNIHLSTRGDDVVRKPGLGPILSRLNDEQLLHVLSYVDGNTLGGGLSSSSRFLYVLSHHEELWRDLCLRRWGEGGIVVPPPPSSTPTSIGGEGDFDDNSCGGCWKDIYTHNHILASTAATPSRTSRSDDEGAKGTRTTSSSFLRRHVPLRISGIYSDALFRSWLCRSFALRPSWLEVATVPTLNHSDVTVDIFLEEYETKNVPLLIKGASNDWDAIKKWKDKDYLRNVAGDVKFRATSGAAPLPAKFAMDDYLNYCMCATEEAPMYLFDRSFGTSCPRLLADFDDDLSRTCGWWDRNAEHGHDLFGLLGDGRRPDYQWLIVGPKRSGSSFHIDPNCTHAWNAPIIGRKRWIFYPPGVDPPGVYPSPDGDDVCMPISIGEWFLTHWDEHVRRRDHPDPSRRPLECTACPGDVLFVPHGWWHMVLNIGDDDDVVGRGASVALTRNYVSASNLPDVLRFLDTKVGQISGCRDRRGEGAISPEDLGPEFRRALMEAAGEEGMEADEDEKKCCDEGLDSEAQRRKGKWADLLEKSEASAKQGWGCDAWKDPSPPCSGNEASCALSVRNDMNLVVENRKNVTTTSGSSILARAKRPAFASNADDTRADGGVAIHSTSLSDGFSFSFL